MNPFADLPAALSIIAGIGLSAAVTFGLVWAVISAWLDGTLSWWEAIFLLSGLVGLEIIAITVMLTRGATLYLALLLLQVSLYGLTLYLGRLGSHRAMERMDLEDIGKYQRALEFDPNNVAAHSFLADSYRKMGYYDHAIAEYQASLRLDPTQLPEQTKLETTISLRERLGSRQMVCPFCQQPRPDVAKLCLACGRAYDTLDTLSFWLHRLRRRRSLLPLLVIVFLVILALLVFLLAPSRRAIP
jgi:tetratricopeptide (TPR) repeat protein